MGVDKIYEPLSFITLVTFHGKVLRSNLTFDEQLPETLLQLTDVEVTLL